MTVEAAIENFVVDEAEKRGWWVRKCKWLGVNGAPDRVFKKKGKPIIFIEFKAPGEPPQSHQVREHEKMRRAGLEVYVCDNARDALRILGIAT